MTTCRDIITHAMRELGVIGVGKQPKAAEAEEAMFRLQAIVSGLIGNGVGTPLADQIIETDTDLSADTRNLIYATARMTVSLPDMPANGARVQIKDMLGNLSTYPLTIEAIPSDLVLSTNNGDWTLIYIGSTWNLVTPLSIDLSIPFDDDEFFTLELAKRLAPVFGVPFPPTSEPALLRAANRIRAKFRSQAVVPCDDAVRFLSLQSYNTGFKGLPQ